ncbi:MAG: AAA family ATPase [Candidatus Dormibacteria bacterium]
MKIGVIGKGGSGKTTVSGVLARSLARQGWEVVAIDCDSNPNLGISLGLGLDQTQELAAIRQALDEGNDEHAPTAEEVLEKFGSVGPDRVRVAVVTRIDKPSGGCPCCGISPEQLLSELETSSTLPSTAPAGSGPAPRALIADMEAGIGTVTRMAEGSLDVAILVTEPTPKAIEVVRRAAEVIAERKIAPRIVILANKSRDASDPERVRTILADIVALEGVEVVVIPEDMAVLAADAQGVSPIDHAPGSPAVEAVAELAQRLAA